ncbi:MAG: hypothetical protein EAX81_01230 [Candidatus Thorarchaeota archaeon]|nr:hypothetical protein [Candidatus Thorarchaeota archaeon]
MLREAQSDRVTHITGTTLDVVGEPNSTPLRPEAHLSFEEREIRRRFSVGATTRNAILIGTKERYSVLISTYVVSR